MQSRFVKRYKGRTSRTACPSLTASIFVASSVLASRLILLRLLPRRSCALCGGCGGVLGGQSVQYAAAVFGGDGLLHKGLELLLGQRDRAGQQLLDKPHALAEAVCPVLALLDQPLFALFPLFVKIGRKLYATKNFSGGGHSDVHLPFVLLPFVSGHAILFLSRTSRIG